uniref:Collagen alpha-1(XXVIII) chain n=1 Tax=Mastacembelus armatus TaxID=205130 RepID=A0A3Q3M2Q9_9TELE
MFVRGKLRRGLGLCLLLLAFLHEATGQRRITGRRNNHRLHNDGENGLTCSLEVAFILDSSEKSKIFLFEKQKAFVLSFSTRLSMLQVAGWTLKVRMAALQYSSSVSIEQRFSAWKDLDSFQGQVSTMNYIGHGTYTTYAITNASQLLVQETPADTVRVAVLMTDGVDHPRNPDVIAAAAEAKGHGVKLFAVGLSDIAQQSQNNAKLRAIASTPAQQFVQSLTDTQLEEKLLKEMVSVALSVNTSDKIGLRNNSNISEIHHFLIGVDFSDRVFNMCVVLQGERGDCGTPGEKGDIGPEGPPGPRGPKGEQSDHFLHVIFSCQGDPGAEGLPGIPGQPAEDGAPGPKGDAGLPGPRGPDGTPGKGVPGEKVRKHLHIDVYITNMYRGEPGPQGPAGALGEPGIGLTGPKVSSAQGDRGPPGPAGAPGLKGEGFYGPQVSIRLHHILLFPFVRLIPTLHHVMFPSYVLGTSRTSCGVTCRQTPLELVFVIDSSESVGPEHFNVIKDFVNALIDRASVSREATRVGVVLYSHINMVVVSLRQEATRDEIKSAVRSMTYLGEGTFTGSAIQQANQVFKAARAGVRKVAIVITDGQADKRDSVSLEGAVREAQGSNIEMFVIGVVNESDPLFEEFKKELNLMASDPDSEHVYLISEFKKLSGDILEGKLLSRICEDEGRHLFSSIPSSRFPPGIPEVSSNVQEPPYRTDTPTFTGDFRRVHKVVSRTNEHSSICEFDTSCFLLSPAERCSLTLDPGPCRDYVVKWYYDAIANSCAQFWFGGCLGNSNQFETEKSCRKTCVKV